jgi:hypothetical protein
VGTERRGKAMGSVVGDAATVRENGKTRVEVVRDAGRM